MALLDDKRDAFVVRIVYDGPPFSGKTTTLRALSGLLARPLETPEEHEGRTLLFDWLDYTAGRFEGRPIRCQVVSVPGQRSLAERRRRLVADADAVVFVADTGRLGIDLTMKYASELAAILAHSDPPRPGVVIQANKRDVDDALDMPVVVEAFRKAGTDGAFIETTATDGSGVREAFLFSVRLALDRVRELSHRGLLRSGRPRVDSSGELVAQLRADEETESALLLGQRDGKAADRAAGAAITSAGGPTEPAATAETRAGAASQGHEGRGSDEGLGELPDPAVPSGFIWPPVEGRIIVQQALIGPLTTPDPPAEGDYCACSPTGWLIHSRRRDVFSDQNAGRSALVDWARLHARNGDLLSRRRCVVLSPCKEGWRLWQIVATVRSLDEFLNVDSSAFSSREVAEHLFVVGRKLLAAATAFRLATVPLKLDVAKLAADTSAPCFTGLMPGFDAERAEARGPDEAVAESFFSPLAKCASALRLLAGRDLEAVIEELSAIGRSSPESEKVAAGLAEVFTKQRAA
jgi:signal recognition particle receptor subunit beta